MLVNGCGMTEGKMAAWVDERPSTIEVNMHKIAILLMLVTPMVGAANFPTDPTSPTYGADWWRAEMQLMEELKAQGWRFQPSPATAGDEMRSLERQVRELQQRVEEGERE
jgi:hypothetical protein